ncbi:GGDEF domain-containing protein [Vibrio mangrovi]|uniref:diguanylate cyclase n=1 Tax=Vibrio mangrovi TaxID=474394 RepID=A0A1Y6J091_9VIBR|nr:GGDEF domain-containing protein [Vibrio mangrovi]MDW6001962.1 GGDEF domain-containing protein [Vibrio mangrovi]SMS02490.1 Diguanylate cyclase DosC [Vibrio mangrovi]
MPEKNDNNRLLISPGSTFASQLPGRLTLLVLLTIIGMSWYLGNYNVRQERKEALKHLKASVWLLKETLDTLPSGLPVHTLPSPERVRIQLIMERMRNNLESPLYLIDKTGQLILTDGEGGPLKTKKGQQLQYLPELKPAIEHLLAGQDHATYSAPDGTHQLIALPLNSSPALVVGDIVMPGWFQSSGFPIYVLLCGGMLLTLLVRYFTRKTVREWRRQSLAQSIIDPLTTLPNRKGFALLSKPIFRESVDHQTSLSLMLINLNDFTHINLTYGTEAGDILIKQVASSLRQLVNTPHLLCRWDGDEFIIMLKEHDSSAAYSVAKSIQEFISRHEFNFSGESVRLKLRIGIHSLGDREDLHSLLSGATHALAQTRKNSDNCILYQKAASI